MFVRSLRNATIALVLIASAASSGPQMAAGPGSAPLYQESLHIPSCAYLHGESPRARSPAAVVATGPFVSVQVNVTALGQNIVGDAANEPSLAVSPLDPNVIVIGWRQFDTVQSNFREAGWAYSHDGGQTWNFQGVLESGVYRSDPVLDVDSGGNFFFQSLSGGSNPNQVFRSTDDGVNWGMPVQAFGGDKNWMAVDRSGGIGDGHVYGTWNRQNGCCEPESFTRSIDGGQSFESPIEIPLSPAFGTVAIGPDGEVYVAGVDGSVGPDVETVVVAKSVDAADSSVVPSFTATPVEMGRLIFGGDPNPGGFAGQVNVAVDHSDGPTRGNVYLLASLDPPPYFEPLDPLDVLFARSTDGGVTWSSPVRVNDDPPGQRVWHWFGAISVAPNGRIDAVWNDSRATGRPSLTQLFYAYSLDAGDTWSENVAVSPTWESHVGWPDQNKIGDYYTMFSDAFGAGVAYAATFNGEQDIYFVRVFPDCNGNGISDTGDTQSGSSDDCNDNDVPDECEPDCNGNGVADDCDIASGYSDDCDGDGLPDDCEPDCNGNGVADDCDIASGSSDDCDGDGLPDDCEPDCNGNDVADDCDIASGSSDDCDGDGVPNECEPDCNGNGVSDHCDILSGASDDCTGNGIPDACDLAFGISRDCNGNEIPDACEFRTFTAQVITDTADGAWSVFGADLNGDLRTDVLSASAYDDKVAWYENTDGVGTFGPQQIISTLDTFPVAALAEDLDGDGDEDVVVASYSNSALTWYENSDGAGAFVQRHEFWTHISGPTSLSTADMDGDDDMDVLATAGLGDVVTWYENLDGLGGFDPMHGERFVNGEVDFPRSVFAADLDDDGDTDVLSASQNDNKIAWHENLYGLGVFDIDGQQVISLDARAAQSVFAGDLDGDGDMDVLSASRDDDKIAWYENLDGAGTFGPERIISTNADGAQSVFAADLDGDSDLDVLSASELDGKVAWYKNIDGAGSFATQPVIATGAVLAKAVFATDLDGDGDADVLAASRGDDTIAWYRNDSNDCSDNAVLDICESDCNGNGEADSCDLLSGTSIDCNGNDVPDECDTQCPGPCDADGDGCLDDLDADPADPYRCGDSDRDSCDDCASGAFDPAGDGLDTDADGSCDAGDCDGVDASVWHEPDAVHTLAVTQLLGTSTLTWLPPSRPGAASVVYDVLRSLDASDFVGPASCLEADETDRSAQDSVEPAPGDVFHYLVRAENGCPGSTGALGNDSAGVPRTGTPCP